MSHRASIAALALAALLGADSRCLAADAPAPTRNIGGPGDYSLRETIVGRLARDPDLGKEHYALVIVNGGAIFSGEISTRALALRAMRTVASVRGIINVTDQLIVPRASLPDATLEKAVRDLLEKNTEPLGLKALKVRVEEGTAILEGVVATPPSRVAAEELAGMVAGITRISNRLKAADAPQATGDPALLKAVVGYLGDWRAYPHPGEIDVSVKEGVVALTGRVPYFLARQQATVVASLVGGVGGVENRIKVDLAFPLSTPGHSTAEVRARP